MASSEHVPVATQLGWHLDCTWPHKTLAEIRIPRTLQICASILKTCRKQLLLILQVKKKTKKNMSTLKNESWESDRVGANLNKMDSLCFQKNTTSKLEPPCLSSRNTDGLLITAEGQSSCYSGAAIQDSLLTECAVGRLKAHYRHCGNHRRATFAGATHCAALAANPFNTS